MKGIRALLVLLVVGCGLAAVAWSAATKTHAIEPIPAFTPADLTAEPGGQLGRRRAVTSTTGSTRR